MEKTPQGKDSNKSYNGSPDMFATPSDSGSTWTGSPDLFSSSSEKSFGSNRSSVPGTPSVFNTAFCDTPAPKSGQSFVDSPAGSSTKTGGVFLKPAEPKPKK